MTTRHHFVCVETPEFRTQVGMYTDGELTVHANVVFEANTARDDGGAVSLPFDTVANPSGCGALRLVLRGLV